MIGAQTQLTNDMILAAGGAQSLILVHDVKKALDDLTKGTVPPDLLMEFPPDVETFQKLRPEEFEQAYAEEKPVPNRVHPLVLSKLKSLVPARNSNNSVRSESGTLAPTGAAHRQQNALALPGYQSTPVTSPIAPMPVISPKLDKPAEVLALAGGGGESLVALGTEKARLRPHRS